jgi:UDP-glucose:(heptosyl)LPS alpha-1,3-glucosyltransferase
MRLALILESLDPARGGAETSVTEMARALAALGIDVTILTAAPPPHEIPGVTIFPLAAGGATKLARTRSFIDLAERTLRLHRFDVVHAITPIPSADVYQPRGGTYRETIERSLAVHRNPLVRAVKRLGRALNARQRYLLRVERDLLTRTPTPPFVAAVSDYVRRQVLAEFSVPEDRIRVVFNGVDIEPLPADKAAAARAALRAELGLQADTPLLLFLAHNFKLKGLAAAIRALLLLSAPGTQHSALAPSSAPVPPFPRSHDPTLLVAGRDNPAPYHRLAARLGVAGRVRFLGPGRRPAELYAAADLLVHPTFYDPCSRVVLEAVCCGLPAITTRWNGACEVLPPHAVIDDPADARALADAIATCLGAGAPRAANPALRERLSTRRHAQELAVLYNV